MAAASVVLAIGAAGLSLNMVDAAGIPGNGWLWLLITGGLLATVVFPAHVRHGRDTLVVGGHELFVAAGLLVLQPSQLLAAAATAELLGLAMVGRAPGLRSQGKVPPRRWLVAVSTVVAGTGLALTVFDVTSRQAGVLAALVLALAAFAATGTGLALTFMFLARRDVPEARRQIRASVAPVLLAQVPMVALATLVGLLVSVQTDGRAVVIASVALAYALLAWLLSTASAQRDQHAALTALAGQLHEATSVTEVADAVHKAVEQVLDTEEVATTGRPDPAAACTTPLGADGQAPWLTVYLRADSRLRPTDEDFLRRVADLARPAMRNTRLREQLHQHATRDQLTDLLNRRGLHERFEFLAATAQRAGNRLALLFLDLDGFKLVNDRYGHELGDRVLVEVAERLRQATRSSDLVARTGGDEFVVLSASMRGEAEASAACERLRREFASRLLCDPTGQVGCSIGAASLPATAPLDELLAMADRRMYESKLARRQTSAGEAVTAEPMGQ